jgi:hypothetical protein
VFVNVVIATMLAWTVHVSKAKYANLTACAAQPLAVFQLVKSGEYWDTICHSIANKNTISFHAHHEDRSSSLLVQTVLSHQLMCAFQNSKMRIIHTVLDIGEAHLTAVEVYGVI